MDPNVRMEKCALAKSVSQSTYFAKMGRLKSAKMIVINMELAII